MYEIFITNQARQNLKDITLYIAQDNPKRAKSFIADLKNHINKRLVNSPLSASIVGKKIRMIPFKRYIILYQVNKKAQRVLEAKIGKSCLNKFY